MLANLATQAETSTAGPNRGERVARQTTAASNATVKATIRNLLVRPFADIVLSFLVIPAAFLLRGYRRLGSARLPATTRRLKRMGVFPITSHYYEPLFDDSALRTPLTQDRTLPGLDLNTSGQLEFLHKLVYAGELADLKLDDPVDDVHAFRIRNGTFESGDAEYLYQVVRAIKPSKIIEIGSGNSTKIAHLAVQKNRREGRKDTRHICIEPYEMPWLEGHGDVEVIRKRLEDCDVDWARELQPGDILFVDSSHVIRPQGDVVTEYLEIFPLLASGVYIHVHDIFTPKDYPRSWVVDEVRFWNEQYLLEALLSNTGRYEVVGALNYLAHNHFGALRKVCPYLADGDEPGSFYIRVR